MLHLLPTTEPDFPAAEGTEAAARMASIRQALRTADLMAGKLATSRTQPVDVIQVWPALNPAKRRCFAARTERTANAALGGLSLLSSGPVQPAAIERLSDELADQIAGIERLFAGR